MYAELGSTWRNLMGDPDQAAHLLGKLIAALGPGNVLWGTDSIWYGSPQDQIQAFRAFEITAEAQERFGYAALSADVKAGILAGIIAGVVGVDAQREEKADAVLRQRADEKSQALLDRLTSQHRPRASIAGDSTEHLHDHLGREPAARGEVAAASRRHFAPNSA